MTLARRLAPLAMVAAMTALGATSAGATVEEFSTFSIATQQQDDESLLDHLLTRLPRAWDAEWRPSPAGLRTSQGCLTSGEWFIETDLRARAALGERAWLGIEYLQSESDILRDDHLDLSFHFPIRVGAAMAMFRPSAEKAAQDFAIGWETGADTTAFELRATWTLEDVFNNFWAFRQTQVGGLSEPYDRRPYEPALFVAARGSRARFEAGAKWLTPSTKRIVDLALAQPLVRRELWGVASHALADVPIGTWTLELRGDRREARGHELPIAPSAVEALGYRRQWSAEVALRTTLGGATTIEKRYLYQSSRERSGPMAAAAFLQTDERLLQLEVTRVLGPRLTARAGGMFERVTVARENGSDFNHGTRNESRAYLGLAARFGRVLVAGVEGIELDPENYDVWLVHDKGFLQLQTTF